MPSLPTRSVYFMIVLCINRDDIDSGRGNMGKPLTRAALREAEIRIQHSKNSRAAHIGDRSFESCYSNIAMYLLLLKCLGIVITTNDNEHEYYNALVAVGCCCSKRCIYVFRNEYVSYLGK